MSDFVPQQTFPNMISLRQLVELYETNTKKKLVRLRSDKKNLSVACQPRFNKKSGLVIVRAFCSHSCGDTDLTTVNSVVPSSSLLASNHELLEKISSNALLPIKEVRKILSKQFSISIDLISKHKALRTRNIGRRTIFGSYEDSYRDLPIFIDKLNQCNDGTNATLEADEGNRFHRCFVSFGASQQGFTTAKKVVALDGTHLHGDYKGVLLAATALDGKGQLFPLAIAVVSIENKDNWSWFLEQFKHLFTEIQTFISDRQKGLIDAVATHFGSIPHAYCIRHLSENLLKKCRKKDVVNLLWKAAGTTDLEEYTNCIQKIHSLSESAYQYLQQIERRNWTTLHFTGKRYGHLTSNIAESLNSWLKSLRGMPLIPMIEKYRIKLSEWWNTRYNEAIVLTQSNKHILPDVATQIRMNVDSAANLEVRVCNINETVICEVGNYPSIKTVNLEAKTCSCLWWQSNGIPCKHAVAALKKVNKAPVEGLEDVYLVLNYKKTYQQGIKPISSKETWETTLPSELQLLPPIVKKAVRRPRRARVQSFGRKRRREEK
ncbi:hypothetical protein RCL1_004693 [Eukaryota sp. TZLM3-RCL]